MKNSYRPMASGWPLCLLAAVLLVGASPTAAQSTPTPTQPAQTIQTTYPVQAPVHGHLSDIFFTAGDRVKRGQLLAKVERPNGSPAYLVAPVAGQIGSARQHLGEHLAAKDTLAIIETAPAR